MYVCMYVLMYVCIDVCRKTKYVELRHGEIAYYDQGEPAQQLFEGEGTPHTYIHTYIYYLIIFLFHVQVFE